ncbi:hypothetical protein SAMN05216525_1758 [Bradyrhizobium sp. Gha]|nr:hypothetical protein SAMN05216525_1758 [Bradyrhizobium sp. Gha]
MPPAELCRVGSFSQSDRIGRRRLHWHAGRRRDAYVLFRAHRRRACHAQNSCLSFCRSYPAAWDAALLPAGPTSNPVDATPRTAATRLVVEAAVADRRSASASPARYLGHPRTGQQALGDDPSSLSFPRRSDGPSRTSNRLTDPSDGPSKWTSFLLSNPISNVQTSVQTGSFFTSRSRSKGFRLSAYASAQDHCHWPAAAADVRSIAQTLSRWHWRRTDRLSLGDGNQTAGGDPPWEFLCGLPSSVSASPRVAILVRFLPGSTSRLSRSKRLKSSIEPRVPTHNQSLSARHSAGTPVALRMPQH